MSTNEGLRTIDSEEAKRLVEEENYTYLDVRTEGEYVRAHPVGAYNIPFLERDPATFQMVPNHDFMKVVEAHFEKDAKLVVACQAGGRSLRAANALVGAGFTNVINNHPGFGGARGPSGEVMPGWAAMGYAVESNDGGDLGYQKLSKKG